MILQYFYEGHTSQDSVSKWLLTGTVAIGWMEEQQQKQKEGNSEHNTTAVQQLDGTPKWQMILPQNTLRTKSARSYHAEKTKDE